MEDIVDCWLVNTGYCGKRADACLEQGVITFNIEIHLMDEFSDEIFNLKYIDTKSSNFEYLREEYKKMDSKFRAKLEEEFEKIHLPEGSPEELQRHQMELLISRLNDLKEEARLLRETMREFDKFEKHERIKELIRSRLCYIEETRLNKWSEAIFCFANDIHIGDLVFMPLAEEEFFAVGKVRGNYEYVENVFDLHHIRDVTWIKEKVYLPQLTEITDLSKGIVPIEVELRSSLLSVLNKH
ncbi:hypothetical protein [uncultured Methanomethylovorans sp.]|uniref:hypothetical protein n=1 Tax=uncultured Methanomethylovorans sp. TaxID=183759 RepID=UPI003749EAA6